MEGQFTRKQHMRFIDLVRDMARKTNKDKIRISLRELAKIYDFTNLLKDEEELEFVLEDLTMELMEMSLVADDGTELPGCGILRLDYPGGKKDPEVKVDPALKSIGAYQLVAE